MKSTFARIFVRFVVMCKTCYPNMTWLVTVDGDHAVVLQVRISIRARYLRNGKDDIDTLFANPGNDLTVTLRRKLFNPLDKG
jgi:hypothetical protein